MKTCIVQSPVKYAGKIHRPGARLDLPDAVADELQADGVVTIDALPPAELDRPAGNPTRTTGQAGAADTADDEGQLATPAQSQDTGVPPVMGGPEPKPPASSPKKTAAKKTAAKKTAAKKTAAAAE